MEISYGVSFVSLKALGKRPIRFVIHLCLLFPSTILQGGSVEEKFMTGFDADPTHQFVFNPALLDFNRQYVTLLGKQGNKDSKITASPNNNTQTIKYKEENDILVLSALWPFGGGSGGLSYAKDELSLKVNNSSASRILIEKKVYESYQMKFVIQMTPNLNFGFLYQYVQEENHLYGAFFLSDDDMSYYKAFMSGYRIGLLYTGSNYKLGAYSAPPLRGKALIDGESKITTDSGSGGVDFLYKVNQRTQIGLGITRWFYKIDERMERSTSPIDQRNISLNGTDIDQYLSKIQNVRFGFKHQISHNIQLVGTLGQQTSVFHFNENTNPWDISDDSFKYSQLELGLIFSKIRFQFQSSFQWESRSQSTITDGTFKLGHRDYQNYSASHFYTLLKFNFSF